MEVLLLALLLAETETHLTARVFPAISIAPVGTGCSNVLLTAEIKGPEAEAWYCPRVEWEHPDGTRSSEESDCPPFEERTDFPRIWRHRVCAPPHPRSLHWTVTVRLSHNGKTVAQRDIEFWVR